MMKASKKAFEANRTSYTSGTPCAEFLVVVQMHLTLDEALSWEYLLTSWSLYRYKIYNTAQSPRCSIEKCRGMPQMSQNARRTIKQTSVALLEPVSIKMPIQPQVSEITLIIRFSQFHHYPQAPPPHLALEPVH